jgi:hypothetical protein
MIHFQFHGKRDIWVPGVQVAEEVFKGGMSTWTICKYIFTKTVATAMFAKM